MTSDTPRGLLCIWTDIDPAHEVDFNRWYDREHMQERVAIPGFQSARRFGASQPCPRPYLALYYTDSLDVFRSEAYGRAFANQTPWSLENFKRMRGTQRITCELTLRDGKVVHQTVTTGARGLVLGEEWVAAEPLPAGARVLPALRRLGTTLVAMTGKPDSTLARHADHVLSCAVDQEACPLNLAPTASTTAQMALGDALAVALLDARGFTADDFARSHPAGSLGRRLLLHITDVMHAGDDVPRVDVGATLSQALVEMSRKRLGMTAVVDGDGRLAGLFTDGDLRRTLDKSLDLAGLCIDDVMARQPRTIESHRLATEAANEMEHHKINGLLVTDRAGNLVGALNMHDLLKAGVV